MSLAALAQQQHAVVLLQRSLERGRLGHAYLFTGERLGELEPAARTLAQALNCEAPPQRAASGQGVECCGACRTCRLIAQNSHPDVLWLRPESKMRVIKVEQMRELLKAIHLKPTAAAWKVGVIVAAERLHESAANAFLKTLEEPPRNSVLILLSTEPHRLLDTILSRCLRLNFGSGTSRAMAPEEQAWLRPFADLAAAGRHGLLNRYRLLGLLLTELSNRRQRIEKTLLAQSPQSRFADAEDVPSDLQKRWDDELKAAVEAEYRRQRGEMLAALQWWLRDVWLFTLNLDSPRFGVPELSQAAEAVAGRLKARWAAENLQVLEATQRLLFSNVQEALALEVGLLKLRL